jgi:hypothetical protein
MSDDYLNITDDESADMRLRNMIDLRLNEIEDRDLEWLRSSEGLAAVERLQQYLKDEADAKAA